MGVWEERRYDQEKRPDDVRSEWDRDYSRLIHSSAFRRLQSKTQVLGLGESDFYRTRLTHSMEVAQIGTGIVKFLEEKYKKNADIIGALPDLQLMNSICLAHDLGHPPFGHGGEVALNVCMRGQGGFEGNGQTLRILSRLDKYTDKHGLNPTRRLLLGVLKYPVKYSLLVNHDFHKDIHHGAQKWQFVAKFQKPPKCYHDAEKNIVNWILEPLDSNEKDEFVSFGYAKDDVKKEKHKKSINKSLDTSIMEIADDVSYGLHDLEDAIALNMIDRDKWACHCNGHEHLFSDCGLAYDDITSQLFGRVSYERKRRIGELVHIMITGVEVRDSGMEHASIGLIKYRAHLAENFEKLRSHLHELVKEHVIFDENVQQLEFKGQKLVVELFEVFATDPERFLPKQTLSRYVESGKDCRVICDFVAGMTDDYATRMYEKIFQPRKGSIFDRL